MKKTLAWLSFPRSGTNHLTDLLAAVPGLSSMTEIFDRGSVQVHSFQDRAGKIVHRLQVLYQGLGVRAEFAGGRVDVNALMKDPGLVRAVHAQPRRVLSLLRAANGGELDSFKLFPRHLEADQIEDLLADPAIVLCCYLRNPLDTWISALKRRRTRAFREKDTTDVRPLLVYEDYRAYLEWRAGWLGLMARHAGRIALCLSYDDLIRLPDDAARATGLSGLLSARGLLDPSGPMRAVRTAAVQDRNTHPADKVAGWETFWGRCQADALDPMRDLVSWPALDTIGGPGEKTAPRGLWLASGAHPD